jgi:anaerobic ribonucleoside-triphosphate reductase
LLEEVLQLVFKAHYEKQVLIEKYGQDFHLREILDGYDKYTYAIGLVGLDETAKLISGDNEVSNKVLENIKDQIVSFITFAVEREKRRSGLCISIEEFSADDASERFSRLDRNVYPESLILFNPRTNKSNYTYGFHIEDKKGIPIDDVIALESRYNYLTSRGVVGIPLNKDILSNIRNLQGCGFRGRLLIER